MTRAASSAQAITRTGAFASLWLILRNLFALLAHPSRLDEANALMTKAETEAAWAILRHTLGANPISGLGVDDFEIVRLHDARGLFDPDFQLKPHVLAARRRARLQRLRDLFHIRIVRKLLRWIATLQGLRGRLRWKRRTAARRQRACIPSVALPLLVPP